MVIGGGVSDVSHNPPGRHGHWTKHGEWHNDVYASPLTENTVNIELGSK
jgi:hypothetical protein